MPASGPRNTPTDIGTIFQKIDAKLVSDGRVPATASVQPAMEDDENIDGWPLANTTGTVLILLRPARFVAIVPIIDGAGRLWSAVDGQIQITMWYRLWLDVADVTPLTLFKTRTYAAITAWDGIISSLEQFDPLDGSGNILTLEPMRYMSWETGAGRARPGWAKFRGNWSCKFIQNLP